MWTLLHKVMSIATPGIRRFFWHHWYDTLSSYNLGFTFMNYGYMFTEADGPPPMLDSRDEKDRYEIQLYHHVVAGVDLAGCDVLEVASGRGGGASYIMRYLKPRSFVGIDASENAVAFCSRIHRMQGLEFRHGFAEQLPVGDRQFDAVICVEASRCFGKMSDFLSEVRRVLRPGGRLLYCDLRPQRQVARLREDVRCSGMDVVLEREITQQVLSALDAVSAIRQAWVVNTIPRPLANLFSSWAGVKGYETYEALRNGETIYLSLVMIK
ncbi:MAG: class I SAM-dependent methyltransferase [Dissulfurispiraceae bacterium]|jgi:ubiquinone/menaquinone biosynthesis C-methylase UbiE